MNIKIFIVTFLLLTLYACINYYVGLRTFKILKNIFPKVNKIIFSSLFMILSSSYVLSFIGGLLSISLDIIAPISIISMFYLYSLFYILIIFPLWDLSLFIYRKSKYKIILNNGVKTILKSEISIIIIPIIILTYGIFQNSNTVFTKYEEVFNNDLNLKVIFLSDLHLSSLEKGKGLKKIVDSVNNSSPDLVIIGGDMIDENTPVKSYKLLSSYLSKIKSNYGVYGVAGNHEYSSNQWSNVMDMYEDGNVNLLLDNFVEIEDKFYIVGRLDLSSKLYTNKERLDYEKLTNGVVENLPIILIDHQPQVDTSIPNNQYIYQLSGHTHNGQLFPLNIIIKSIFKDSYGYYGKDNYNLLVSSGIGAWGAPFRVGTKSEILQLKIR